MRILDTTRAEGKTSARVTLVLSALFSFVLAATTSTDVFGHTFDTTNIDAISDLNMDAMDLQFDAQNRAGLCARDEVTDSLVYGWRDGNIWRIETVQGGRVQPLSMGTHCSLVYDHENRPHVAYYDVIQDRLLHAVKVAGVWQIRVVMQNAGSSLFSENSLDLAVNIHGTVGLVAYDSRQRDLLYATYAQGVWQVERLRTLGTVGLYPSLTYDSEGLAGIAYMEQLAPNTGRLMYLHRNGQNWDEEIVDDSPGTAGRFTSLVYDKNDVAHISYQWTDAGFLQNEMFISRNDEQWGEPITLAQAGVAGVAVGAYSRMVMGPEGNATIIYRQDFASALFGRFNSIKLATLNFVDTGDDADVTVTVKSLVNNNQMYAYQALAVSEDGQLILGYAQADFMNRTFSFIFSTLTSWSPAIRLSMPVQELDVDASVNLTWQDFDPDSNARIQFHYQDDHFNTFPLGDAILENEADAVQLDTSDLPDGDYRVYATISDDGNLISYSNSIVTLHVHHPVDANRNVEADEQPIREDNPNENVADEEAVNNDEDEAAAAEDENQGDAVDAIDDVGDVDEQNGDDAHDEGADGVVDEGADVGADEEGADEAVDEQNGDDAHDESTDESTDEAVDESTEEAVDGSTDEEVDEGSDVEVAGEGQDSLLGDDGASAESLDITAAACSLNTHEFETQGSSIFWFGWGGGALAIMLWWRGREAVLL